jgi:cytochrome P450/NADPH-cytochrome P450 reductase
LSRLTDIYGKSHCDHFTVFIFGIRCSRFIGPIWKFYIGGERIVVASQALANELCDEERFSKVVSAALWQVRNGTRDGLFTALGPEEKNWGIAHRVLLPALGPLSIRNMFDEMHDIASQLVLKWARQGPESIISVTDDFTRLTLDTYVYLVELA